MKIRLQTVLLALVVSIVGLANAADHHKHGKAADEVMISDAYARAVAPMQKNSAVFMKLMNHSNMEHAIVRASGDVAQAIELHTHINDNGVMRMRPIDKIAVPANGHAELKPGGLHVMLIGLNKQLKEGDMVHITLEYEDGSTKMLMAPVKKVQGMSHGDHGKEMHGDHDKEMHGGHGMQEKKQDMHNMKGHNH